MPFAAILLSGLTLANHAQGALLLIEYSGTFSSTSQLNGVNLGVHGHPLGTSFTIHSVFDSALDLSGTSGFGLFAASSTIDLNSYGTFTVAPTGPHVYFQTIAGTFVRTGLATAGGSSRWDINLPASPAVLPPDAPVPGAWLPTSSSLTTTFTIPLAGTDTLFVQGLVSSFSTVVITPVPEPSSVVMLACAAAVVARCCRRMRSV